MTYICSTHVSRFTYIFCLKYKTSLQCCCWSWSIAAQHSCNLRIFYMGVVLGITIISCILIKSLLLSHSHPISPYRNKYIEISFEGTAALRIRYSMVCTHTSWSPRKSPPFEMSCTPYFVQNMAPMALSLGNLAPCYETCKNPSMFHECIILDKSTWSNLGFMIWFKWPTVSFLMNSLIWICHE